MKVIKLFMRWIKGNKLSLVFALVVLVVLDYIRSLVPVFISHVYSIVNPKKNKSMLPKALKFLFEGKSTSESLVTTAVLILSVIVIRDTLNLLYDYQVSYAAEGIGNRVQNKFYSHVQKLPYSFLSKNQTGDLIQRSTSDINRFKRFISGILPNMINNILLICFYYYQMVRVDFVFASVSILLAPILLIYSYFYYKKLQDDFERLEEYEGAYTSIAQENLTNIRVVKAFANEDFEEKKYANAFDKYIALWQKQMKKISFYWGFTDFAIFLQILISLCIAIYFYQHGVELTGATLVFMCLQEILWRSRNIGRQLNEMNKTSIAVSRIMEILDEPDEFSLSNGSRLDKIKGEIEFKNVSFTFDDTTIPTLDDISFQIKQGETIALIGKTGSGKTTLINLLNRMLEVSSGKILIDGVDIKEFDKHHLRRNIGTCMQEPFLYSRTIKENIGILQDTIDESTIHEVAKTASLEHDIKDFKDGFETMVGERGVTLSGGQKQRIAISRILTEHKPILIFDDSLSAVDTETDKKIRKRLSERQNKITTIIITHKILSAMNADKIMIVENGKLSAFGSHKELLASNQLYKTIYHIQTQFDE